MDEKSEVVERISGESKPLEAMGTAERIKTGLERFQSETFDSEEERFESISQGIGSWLRERSEDTRELADAAREMLKKLDFEKHPDAETVLDGLEKVSRLLEKGAEALEGEKAEAMIQLLAIAFLIILNPEAGLEFLSKNPEVLSRAAKLLEA